MPPEPAPAVALPHPELVAGDGRCPGLDGRVRDLVARGDVGAAATEALRALSPAVRRYLRSVLRDEDDAADAHSEWSERLCRGLAGFRWSCALRTWAFRIAANVARNAREEAWRRRRRRLSGLATSVLRAQAWTLSPYVHERHRLLLERLRARVTASEQSLLNLRLDQGLSWNEIAQILEVEPAALMKRFERLKGRLRRTARDEGLIH
jgi:RNA polymerase sigma-70 factor (ECF subfamily)